MMSASPPPARERAGGRIALYDEIAGGQSYIARLDIEQFEIPLIAVVVDVVFELGEQQPVWPKHPPCFQEKWTMQGGDIASSDRPGEAIASDEGGQ